MQRFCSELYFLASPLGIVWQSRPAVARTEAAHPGNIPLCCRRWPPIIGNAQPWRFSPFALFSRFCWRTKSRRTSKRCQSLKRVPASAYAAVLCLGALLFLPQFTSDLVGLAYGAWRQGKATDSGRGAPLHVAQSEATAAVRRRRIRRKQRHIFTTYVNDGVALLERESRPERNDPDDGCDQSRFPTPWSGDRRGEDMQAPMYHFNMSDEHRPSDDWYFGDADIVMVPKRASQGDNHYIDFYKAYEPGLKTAIRLAAESDRWWMYRRK